MNDVEEHYERVVADVYSWMFGGFDNGLSRNREFFRAHGITAPTGSKVVVDLGAGCGFQAIPLAECGYTVVAIDSNQKLLDELSQEGKDHCINVVCDDFIHFDQHLDGRSAELIVCMTDSLIHLESKESVLLLFKKIFDALESDGQLIITFRDLSLECFDLERLIPVRSDNTTIMTCFLEYESEHVKVNDIVYKNNGDFWELEKGFYRKLRLSKEWVDEQLEETGFSTIQSSIYGGFVTIIANKSA